MSAPSIVAPDLQLQPVRSAAVAPVSVGLRGVDKRFGDGPLVLESIDLDCPPGEITVLVGPSGCGKTTLLRSIAGLEQVTDGQVMIDGQDVSGAEPQSRGVAMVFQNYALYPDKTARENITFPLKMARVPRPERGRRVDTVAQLLRIEELLDRKPSEMSGGQRQRVGIGRALVRGPKVLLMDEPLSNLDAQLRVQMRSELLALQRELGTTMLYVTHDQVEALTLGSVVVVMNGGHIAQTGPPSEVFGHPTNAFVAGFLGGMNLVEGKVDKDAVECGNIHIQLPQSLRTLHGRRLVVGLRPELIHRGEADQDELEIQGPVHLVELLGSDQLVHLGRPGSTIRMREASGPVPDNLRLRAHVDDMHLFDPDNDGTRLDLT